MKTINFVECDVFKIRFSPVCEYLANIINFITVKHHSTRIYITTAM